MVAPATGFAHFYFLRYSFVADHYQYMAIIGMIALVAAVGYSAAIRLGTGAIEFVKVVSFVLVVVLGSLKKRFITLRKRFGLGLRVPMFTSIPA
jgi:hypothetical protein